MGVEVSKYQFNTKDYSVFASNLEKETLLLNQWLTENGVFEDDSHSFGLEIEAWILDKNGIPYPINTTLLKNINSKNVVPELSKYNIEINGDPHPLSKNCFSKMEENLRTLWTQCQSEAIKLGGQLLLAGTAPTLKWDMLQPEIMSEGNRYRAVANVLYKKLHEESAQIFITGQESLSQTAPHVIVASAATSIQPHWKVPISKAKDYFNASQFVSPIIAAISANCPHLFQKSLWEESRVPFFEQAIDSSTFHRRRNKRNSRAIFGQNYIVESIGEYFSENLSDHGPLLPLTDQGDLGEFHHLNLHNSTVWRWNRPIIGKSKNGKYHVRIEHRVPSSGPTFKDSMATMMFFVGLVHELVEGQSFSSQELPFLKVKENFYRAAQKGLEADVHWFNKKIINLGDLVLLQLLPMAQAGLLKLGIDPLEVDEFLGIIAQRARSKQTGSQWQKDILAKNNNNFQQMTLRYLENQQAGQPVHMWKK